MSQVRGKVLYKDGSPPRGVAGVMFKPAGNTTAEVKKVASGMVESDGSFVLSTYRPSDGVYHGQYDVLIVNTKSETDPTPLIKPEYSNPSTTPLPTVTVDGDISDLKFEVEPLPAAK